MFPSTSAPLRPTSSRFAPPRSAASSDLFDPSSPPAASRLRQLSRELEEATRDLEKALARYKNLSMRLREESEDDTMRTRLQRNIDQDDLV